METEGSAGERVGTNQSIQIPLGTLPLQPLPDPPSEFSKVLVLRLDYGSRVQSPCRIWSHDYSECLERYSLVSRPQEKRPGNFHKFTSTARKLAAPIKFQNVVM